jgi:hypothetical protein
VGVVETKMCSRIQCPNMFTICNESEKNRDPTLKMKVSSSKHLLSVVNMLWKRTVRNAVGSSSKREMTSLISTSTP